MKYIINILLLNLLLLSCTPDNTVTSKEKKNNTERYHLKGKVKFVTETSGEFNKDLDLTEVQYKREYSFNESGILYKSAFYEKVSTYTYETNIDGSPRKQLAQSHSVVLSSTTKNNENGDLLELVKYEGDGMNVSYKITKEYDETGKLIKRDNFNLFYDDNGYLIREQEGEKAKAGEIIWNQEILYTNNESGKPIEEVHKPNGINKGHRITYKYDQYGNQSERNEINNNGVVTKSQITTYNSDGQILEMKVFENGQPTLRYTYVFDDKGNVIEENNYQLGERWALPLSIDYMWENKTVNHYKGETLRRSDKMKRVFEYDDQGNWIKSVEYSNNEPSIVEVREIEYYQ